MSPAVTTLHSRTSNSGWHSALVSRTVDREEGTVWSPSPTRGDAVMDQGMQVQLLPGIGQGRVLAHSVLDPFLAERMWVLGSPVKFGIGV